MRRDFDLIERIKSAERPLFLAGHGVRLADARDLFMRAVQDFEIPYMVTTHAKGYLPEDNAHFLGVIGFCCPPENEMKIASLKPDLIVALGSRLGELATLGWSDVFSRNTTLVQVLNDPEDFTTAYPTAIPFEMDLRELLERLTQDSKGSPALEEFKPVLRKAEKQKHQSPVHPVDFVHGLQDVLGKNGLIVSDIGNSLGWLASHFVATNEKECYIPLGLLAMGAGIGAAIGAKMSAPDRQVVCVTGDCAMIMYGNEILTAREQNAGVIFVVLNDGGHGMVLHGHKLIGLPNVELRFKNQVNFEIWAEGFGVEAHTVRSMEEFFDLPWSQWSDLSHPIVIDLHIDPEIVPPIKSRARILGQTDQVTQGGTK